MKAISLFSGGKDSFLAASIAQEQGFEIVRAITVLPEEFSMMYHFPNAEKSTFPAKLLGIDTMHISEGELLETISSFVEDGVEALISGAIASEYQKTRIERMCTELGIISYTPLWRKDQLVLLNELQLRGIEAIVVSVSAEGLVEEDLGKIIDAQYIDHLIALREKYRINLAGEGGEFESFVVKSGGSKKIKIKKSRKIWEGSHGYLIIEDAELV